jgi:hypothetical protein
MKRALGLLGLSFVIAACGPNNRDECTPDTLMTDPDNCGVCGYACDDGEGCVQGVCTEAACEAGTVEPCYTGTPDTQDIGLCHGGTRTCNDAGTWNECVGEVTPHQEACGNGTDENCNGVADENVDVDGDGFTTCDGDCADNDELVNPGAFETNGNQVDDDCDGAPDNALEACDTGIFSNTVDGLDFARAMDICQTTSEASRRWGVIDARLSFADGNGTPSPQGHSVRDNFGTVMLPPRGGSLIVLSSGAAADATDTNPAFVPGTSVQHGETSAFPQDWFTANGNMLPNVVGCPPPSGNNANDPEMITMRLRVPSNAKSFSVKVNFFSHEYPEYTCTQYNDFFVVLLDSTYVGDPANPADKNLAFYTNPTTMERVPVGVNLAYGNTGLFTSCHNGTGGCSGSPQYPFMITTCTDNGAQLPGTGFDVAASFSCEAGQTSGGGTGWLTTSGNVVGGEIITLRFAIWDTSDQVFDSTVLIDDFKWSVDAAEPGTVID